MYRHIHPSLPHARARTLEDEGDPGEGEGEEGLDAQEVGRVHDLEHHLLRCMKGGAGEVSVCVMGWVWVMYIISGQAKRQQHMHVQGPMPSSLPVIKRSTAQHSTA